MSDALPAMRTVPCVSSTAVSATPNTVRANCSTTRTDTPSAAMAATWAYNSATISGASPIDSSSSSKMAGSVARARANDSICCSPPDIVPANCVRRSLSRGKRAYVFSSMSLILCPLKVAMSRFSRTVRLGKMPRPSGMVHSPARANAPADAPVTSRPATIS